MGLESVFVTYLLSMISDYASHLTNTWQGMLSWLSGAVTRLGSQAVSVITVQHGYNEHGYNELTDIMKQFLMYGFFPYLFHYKRSCILLYYEYLFPKKFRRITNFCPTENRPVVRKYFPSVTWKPCHGRAERQ